MPLKSHCGQNIHMSNFLDLQFGDIILCLFYKINIEDCSTKGN